MCDSRRPANGADSGDIFDQLATYLVASAFLDALTCGACSLPAVDGHSHERVDTPSEDER